MDVWPNMSSENLFDPTLRKAYLYHHQLAIACSRAASRPWKSVRSDPRLGLPRGPARRPTGCSRFALIDVFEKRWEIESS